MARSGAVCACRLVRYEQGAIEVKRDFDPDLPLVFAHPYKMIQVFSNLILNAFQAMNGKGCLTLKTKRLGHDIRVEIHDTGPGIPEDRFPRLFTPFFTTRDAGASEDEGTGLGLYISKNIIDELKGKIRVESEQGKGTTFIITIPARETKK